MSMMRNLGSISKQYKAYQRRGSRDKMPSCQRCGPRRTRSCRGKHVRSSTVPELEPFTTGRAPVKFSLSSRREKKPERAQRADPAKQRQSVGDDFKLPSVQTVHHAQVEVPRVNFGPHSISAFKADAGRCAFNCENPAVPHTCRGTRW